MSAARGRRSLLGVALAAVAVVVAAQQPDEPLPAAGEIVEEELAEDTAALLEKAEEVFASAEQPQSIPLFGQIIGLLERRLLAGPLLPEEGERLTHSLFRRAEARFNIGESEGAREDLEAILRLDPAYAVPPGSVSPKLVGLLEKARAATVGVLDPLVDPPDAELLLDGESLGTLAGPRPVLAGAHRLAVRRPGHTPVEMEIEVPAGGSLPVELTLERTSAVARLTTRPAGVEVVHQGEVVAVSGATTDDEIVGEVAVEGLGLGEQVLELRKEGYRPARLRVEVGELADYTLAPVRLEPTRGTVVVSGLPPASRLLVDGEPLATAGDPGRLSFDLPPGSHRIEVRAGFGGLFERRIELADRQTLELVAELRPSLVLLGVLGADRVAATQLEERLAERLAGLAEWAVQVRAERGFELVRQAGLDRQQLRALASATAPPEGPGWQAVQELFDREVAGSAYLLAVLSDDLYASQADLWLWSGAPGPVRPARRRIALAEETALDGLAVELDRPLPLVGPWLGARLIDSRLAGAPLVLSVEPGGPAAAAGLRPGERLARIGSEAVTTVAEARAAIAAREIGEQLELEVGGTAAASRQVTLTLGSSPRVLELAGPELLGPALAARLVGREQRPGEEAVWLARLNRAVVLMRSSEWRRAVEALREVRAPGETGLSQPTVEYLLGVALLEADRAAYLDTARDLIGRAADSRARLGHHDGPLLAARARARLETLVPRAE